MSTSSIEPDDSEIRELPETPESIIENIRQALKGLKFGEITITVRNGSVVQIDRIARKRQFKS